MGVTITKSKKAKTAKTAGIGNVVTEVAERYVADRLELTAKLAQLAALQASVDAGEKQLLEYVDTLVSAAEPTEITVGDYVVKFGAKGRKAVSFDNDAIRAHIGADTFDKIATFKIEDLKKYMTGEAFDKAVEYANVNKRKVTIEEAQDA